MDEGGKLADTNESIIIIIIDRPKTPTYSRRHRHHELDQRSNKAAEINPSSSRRSRNRRGFFFQLALCSLEAWNQRGILFFLFFIFLSFVLPHQLRSHR